MTDLNDRLLTAHAVDDRAALMSLYTEAADVAPDVDTACFFLTHAYVYALELGHADTAVLHSRLAQEGRV